MKLRRPFFWGFLLLGLLLVTNTVFAQGEAGYLQYQDPPPPTTSIFSTVAYCIVLLVVFALILFLAYATSRFMGKKLGQMHEQQNMKVLSYISLGNRQSLQVVDVAGKILIIGVSEHYIGLLSEVTDAEEIEKLHSTDNTSPGFEQIFQNQLSSLQSMTHKFPSVFGDKHKDTRHHNDNERYR